MKATEHYVSVVRSVLFVYQLFFCLFVCFFFFLNESKNYYYYYFFHFHYFENRHCWELDEKGLKRVICHLFVALRVL